MSAKTQFSIDYQYKKFLKEMKIDQSSMHEGQKREAKKMFYSGCWRMAVFLLNDASKVKPKKYKEGVQKMMDEISAYFNEEVARSKES